MMAELVVQCQINTMESIFKSDFNLLLCAVCLYCLSYSQREYVFIIVFCQLIQG